MRTRSTQQSKFTLKQWAKKAIQSPPSSKYKPQHLKSANCNYEDPQEDTATNTLAFSKLRYINDDQQTKKVPMHKERMVKQKIEKQQLKLISPSSSKQVNHLHHQKYQTKTVNKQHLKASDNKSDLDFDYGKNLGENKIPQIPYNKKVDEIMNRKPLRQRLAGLLPSDISLPISFDHQQILKRMDIIDRTISFLISHRGYKIVFFSTVRKSVAESSNIYLEQKTLKQLLYLDPNCYNIQWKINEKNKKYDLKISLPENITSMDTRRIQMRKHIVKYLLEKQAEFLLQIKAPKAEPNSWHPKFQYKKEVIPMRDLPLHPNIKDADLRTYSTKQLSKVQNPLLKSILQTKKQQSEVKSISKASVADMIFNKMPASQISEKLMSSIKQKQKKNLTQSAVNRVQCEKSSYQVCLKITRQIMMIYMSKNVSNIFKVTLLQMLFKRLKFKDNLVQVCLQKILTAQYQSDNKPIGFLKQIQSSQKVKVIQINRQKFKQIEQYFQNYQ